MTPCKVQRTLDLRGTADPADFPFLPFSEAITALRRRGRTLVPSGHWTEVWQEAHHVGFTVARSAGFDILGGVHRALEKALINGQTFAQFRKELTPLLQKKGWWGVTEEGVQLGSPRRLRTIYDVNMRVSAAQGNWARQQRLKDDRPYLRYVGLLDHKIRLLHRGWHGIILHIDHPWWKTHYPPNGWRCRCGAEDLSQDDLDRFGYRVSNVPPEDGFDDWAHPVTGELRKVPRGIDPGWDYNPGNMNQAAHAAVLAVQKTASLPPSIGARALEEMIERLPASELMAGGAAPAALRRVLEKGLADWMQNPVGNFPLAIIPVVDAAAISSTARIAKMSPDDFDKQVRHHPELTAQDYALVQEAVENGEKYRQTDKKIAYAFDKEGSVAVIVKATKVGDEIFVTSVWRISKKTKKRQDEIARLRRGKQEK